MRAWCMHAACCTSYGELLAHTYRMDVTLQVRVLDVPVSSHTCTADVREAGRAEVVRLQNFGSEHASLLLVGSMLGHISPSRP